jgi:hypothetical protein
VFNYIFLFLLVFIHSKKVVFLIVPEGKKCRFHYNQQQIGGKLWELMVGKSGEEWGEGIIPHVTP